MRNIILTYEGFKVTNIGDYIQSLAACQFFHDGDETAYHPRDELSTVSVESRVIMNGWFTHKPKNWPPSEKIHPLFVSFHINSQIYDELLDEKSIAYLKKNEPIGCRDEDTVEMLKSRGVNAYFSSCLTTTIGYSYHSDEKNGKIYVVDAVHYVPEVQRRLQKYKFIPQFLFKSQSVNQLLHSFKKNESCPVDYNRFCGLVRTHALLQKLLSPDDMKNMEILTQFHNSVELSTNEQRFQRAKELIKLYSKAKLVITSRIHVALPCLGLGTPVIFLQNLDDSFESSCRFKGLLDLLNVIQFQKDRIVNSPFTLPLKPDEIKNSDKFKRYADELIEKCIQFMGTR